KALLDRGLGVDFFTLINQSPPVGATSIQEKKIDAHADFCPWGELMEFKGFARKIFDGSQTGVAYLHGPVVRKDFLDKHGEIVVAYLKAVVEANDWITRNPEEATTKQEQWTSIPKEVLYLYFGRGGFLTLDATIKPKWVEVLKYDASVLQKMGIIKQADVEGVIDDRFVRQAYRELGRDYAKDQKVMAAGTSPMEGKDATTGAPIKDPRAAGELWMKGEAIKPYGSLATLMGALREAEGGGRTVDGPGARRWLAATRPPCAVHRVLLRGVALLDEVGRRPLRALPEHPDTVGGPGGGGGPAPRRRVLRPHPGEPRAHLAGL